MAPDPRMDEGFEIGFASDEKILAYTSEHFGACGSKLCLGDFDGELLTLAGANEAEGCPCPHRSDLGGSGFCQNSIIHSGPI